MNKNLIPPDISEGVHAVAKKLQAKNRVMVKTSSNPITQGYLLSELIDTGDFPLSPVLLVVFDEYEKFNLWTRLEKFLAQNKTRVPIFTDLKASAINALRKNNQCLIILTQEEAEASIVSPKIFAQTLIRIKAGAKMAKEKLLQDLINAGYTIQKTAVEPGIAASRGSIVDIYPPQSERVIRVDFDDEEIDAIKEFLPRKNKTKSVKSATIIPFNLEHLSARAKMRDYNKNLKQIEFELFPPEADVLVSFTNSDLQTLAQIIEPPEPDRGKKPEKSLSFIKSLKQGDYVVHLDHGVASFEGIVQQKFDSTVREYFKLQYAEGDVLFLPVTMAEKIEKYIGSNNPTLSRLSGPGWQKTMHKVNLDTLRQARELLNTQAKRQMARAISIPRSKEIESSIKKSFPYQETDDQKNVIEDVYGDMNKLNPMDRLVCGDVGFGKTEIAIRAAARVALEGRQVALLSPTTILTQQHLDTFNERLKEFPLQIRSLSRFASKKEQEQSLHDLEKGKIDIIIGTHRLLSNDVKFSNLGLIIIDEEQRFGVKHKEQLKKLRAQTHVLTLTATPIPRTLHLAISGVRTISNISTPPSGRKPIETYIEPYNQKRIIEAIQSETERGGQVYYLYNKVETIDIKKMELEGLLPRLKFGILHGQLEEKNMASVMHSFDGREIDVLVCSTIIENGLDLPNVNTLIVDNAVQFGLAQLHQIRGRIGRGTKKAFAYFFFRRHKLTGEAGKRLEALEQANMLGAGYDLAVRDMEIRGVGNVLGRAQHGHVKSIGLGLYLRMLNKAVRDIKSGEITQILPDISIDLPLEARIPQFFEGDKQKRIELYHTWALIEDLDALRDVKKNLLKEGALPQAIENLFYILKLKLLGRKAGISAIDTAFQSPTSTEQIILLKTPKPIEPKQFAKMLDITPLWQYSTEEIKIPKKDLGSDWTKKLEQSINKLADNGH